MLCIDHAEFMCASAAVLGYKRFSRMLMLKIPQLHLGLTSRLVRQWSGFLLRPLFGLLLREVSGTVRRLPMGTGYG